MVSQEDFFGRARLLTFSVATEIPDAVARVWILNNTAGATRSVFLKDATTLFFPKPGMVRYLVNIGASGINVHEQSGGPVLQFMTMRRICAFYLGYDSAGDFVWHVGQIEPYGVVGNPL